MTHVSAWVELRPVDRHESLNTFVIVMQQQKQQGESKQAERCLAEDATDGFHLRCVGLFIFW